ncbi:EcWRKY-14 [Eragrostis curvula]|uniref:EcWRKY-14 n=1 Tax=Eragrostis curvula TaxID=38414 RepID=A0A5J9TCV9_9POAL|nr:EcWRKY-14 [Eragrostis curvula]
MESFDDNGGCRLVVTELSHIKDLVLQLEVHLDGSPDLCRHLTSKIFTLTERSIGIITSSNFESGRKRCAADAGFATATPRTQSTKKRKMTDKMKNQVRVSSAGGSETPVDDGHSWRKYGQKEILGAKYPRGYYRCTHKHSQGCNATKQLQRTDEDPTLFDVFYVGTHTCVHKTETATAAATHEPESNQDAHSPLRNLSAGLTVKTEGLAAAAELQDCSATTPFSFASTPASFGGLEPERSPLSAPSTSDASWAVTPATSDSNDVVASFSPFEWRAQSELHEVVSELVAASAPSVPAVDIADEFLDIDAISSFFA